MRVRVRALIWHDGLLLVRRESRMGREPTALPGGRVKDNETRAAALTRERPRKPASRPALAG
jgi:ADP-ribose pyrophosphatase YjhB (NUDIX family)